MSQLSQLGATSLWAIHPQLGELEAYRVTYNTEGVNETVLLAAGERGGGTREARFAAACELVESGYLGRETVVSPAEAIGPAGWSAVSRCMVDALWNQPEVDPDTDRAGPTLDDPQDEAMRQVLIEGVREGRYRALVRERSDAARACVESAARR